jgi:hypothetical protein
LLLLGSAGPASAFEPPPIKPATRISKDLADLVAPSADTLSASEVSPDGFSVIPPSAPGGWVVIDTVASDDPGDLEKDLIALGARGTTIAARLVSARLPVAAVPSLESIPSLRFARQALNTHHAGEVATQGDKAMRADIARNTFGLDGSGTTVGVLSDSFDCQGGASGDMSSGDLPWVTVLEEDPGCSSGTDEGRALLQIVHDVAPGASLMFATDIGGQATAANRILALRAAGANVIVDDFFYLAEPMYQDGVIAQAVDEVAGNGVAYFSSAGNSGRLAYEHEFVPGPFASGVGTLHNFGGTILQRITMPPGSRFILVLQWDSPFFSVSGAPGTPNDLDIYLLDSTGQNVLGGATTSNIVSGDPVELFSIMCNASVPCVGNFAIANFTGPNPGRFKYILFARGGNPTTSPALNSGTIYGHANANGAIAVGAANYKTPTTLESFSAGGTTPVLFDTDGSRLSSPDPRQFKPEIVAPDGVDTTFFPPGNDTDGTGFPNFFGTSASAPHAAAVAALLRHAMPSLTPADVRTVLENTAKNMGPAGFDNNTGFGLIQADAALEALHEFRIDSPPSGIPNPVNPAGTVSLSVTASDSFGHSLTYAWTSTCTGGLLPGSFDDASSPSPTWTAPANGTGVSRNCALKVTVSDGTGSTATGTHTATVLSTPRVTSFAPSSVPVGGLLTINGSSLAGATEVTFAGPVTVVPTLVTPTSVKVVVPAGSRTGVLSVTTPVGVGPSLSVLKIPPKIADFTPGAAVGGSDDLVTVSGTNLRAATGEPTVKVGTTPVPAALIQSSTPTQLVFKVPLGAVTAKITVKTVDGTTTSANSLTVIQGPRANTFSPNPAPVGTLLTIAGANLLGVTDVTFSGGVTISPDQVVSATTLKVTVPDGAMTGPVALTNGTGTTTSVAILKIAPRIDDFTPNQVMGGSDDPVTVNGMNLRAAAGEPTVRIGTTPVPASVIQSSTPTQLVFKVPLGAVTAKITVKTVDGTASSTDSLTVTQGPRANTFSPNPAPIGTLLTIAGANLLGVTNVTFSGGVMVVPDQVVSATTLKVTVPTGALAGPVALTNGTGTTTSVAILKIAPRIDDFTPGQVVGGSDDPVTVNGTNLRAAAGEPTVRIGTTPVPASLIQSSTPTQLVFKVPLGAVTSKISVTTAGGTATSPSSLTVQQPPRIKSFSPASGAVGTTVTMSGTNLQGVTDVTFAGGVTVAPIGTPTATSLKVTVPEGAETGPVTVTDPVGTTTSAAVFKLPPKITGFDPPVASLGSTVVVSGTNLAAGGVDPVVKVGAVQAVVVAASPTEVTFTVPILAVTAKITLTNPGGVATSGPSLTVTP